MPLFRFSLSPSSLYVTLSCRCIRSTDSDVLYILWKVAGRIQSRGTEFQQLYVDLDVVQHSPLCIVSLRLL